MERRSVWLRPAVRQQLRNAVGRLHGQHAIQVDPRLQSVELG